MNRRLFLCLLASPIALAMLPRSPSLKDEYLRRCLTQGLMSPDQARHLASLPATHRDWAAAPVIARGDSA